MKGRVLEVTKRHIEKLNKDVFDVNVESEGKTTKYQCWSNLLDRQGKEIEFTVKPAPEGTTFLPTLELPKGDGSSGFKKPFTPFITKSSDPANLAMMELSYKKDTMRMAVDIALAVSGRADHFMTELEIAKMAVEVYKKIGYPLFHKEKTVTAEQVANAVGGKVVVDDSEIPFN